MGAAGDSKKSDTENTAERRPSRTRYQVSPLATLRGILRHYFFAIVGAAVFALLLRVFVLEAFRIPTDLMSPTLLAGDHIFVNKLAYRGPFRNKVSVGDVVVFTLPNDPAKEYIKRVVALEGDRIEIRDGEVFINDRTISKKLDGDLFEETLGGHAYQVSWAGVAGENRKMMPLKVPSGQMFVLADNRSKTQDSRSWGFLPAGSAKGRAALVWFSAAKGMGGGKSNIRWSRVFKRVR